MNFPAALTAAQQGKTISRLSLPDVSLIWIASSHAAMEAQLVRLFPDGAVGGHQTSVADMAAADWVAA